MTEMITTVDCSSVVTTMMMATMLTMMIIKICVDDIYMVMMAITSALIAAITFRVRSLISHTATNAHEANSALLTTVYLAGTHFRKSVRSVGANY